MQALMESEVRRDSLVKDTVGWGRPLVEPGRLVGRVAWRRVWHAAKFLSHSPLRAEVKQVVKNLKTAGKCGDEPRRTVPKVRDKIVLNAGGCRVEERARDRPRGNGAGLV